MADTVLLNPYKTSDVAMAAPLPYRCTHGGTLRLKHLRDLGSSKWLYYVSNQPDPDPTLLSTILWREYFGAEASIYDKYLQKKMEEIETRSGRPVLR